MATQYFVYLARCKNDTFYTGYTANVERRLASHNRGQGGHYTARNRPLTLVATWTFDTRWDAIRAERELKRLPPARKLALAHVALHMDDQR